MKKVLSLSLLSASLLASFAAQAAEMKITGEIVPNSCVPTFPSGNTLDFGKIFASSLRDLEYNHIEPKKTSFNVNCRLPTKFSVKIMDNRASSALAEALQDEDPADGRAFGLGTPAGSDVKIGAYHLSINWKGDNNQVYPLVALASPEGSLPWWGLYDHNKPVTVGTAYAFSKIPDIGLPEAFTVVSGDIDVSPVLNKASALPLSTNIPLDGSATFEIKYL